MGLAQLKSPTHVQTDRSLGLFLDVLKTPFALLRRAQTDPKFYVAHCDMVLLDGLSPTTSWRRQPSLFWAEFPSWARNTPRSSARP